MLIRLIILALGLSIAIAIFLMFSRRARELHKNRLRWSVTGVLTYFFTIVVIAPISLDRDNYHSGAQFFSYFILTILAGAVAAGVVYKIYLSQTAVLNEKETDTL